MEAIVKEVVNTMYCTVKTKPIARFTLQNMKLLDGIPCGQWKSRVCIDKEIIFHDGYDHFVGDIFPNAKTVIFNNCTDVFLYYNLNKVKFPNITSLYSNSDPPNSRVMQLMIHNPGYVGYLTSDHYKLHLGEWWKKDCTHVQEITPNDYRKLLQSYIQIDPTFEGIKKD